MYIIRKMDNLWYVHTIEYYTAIKKTIEYITDVFTNLNW